MGKVVIDGGAVAQILRSPNGPMGRHLISKATQFQRAAKLTLQPHRKSGCLEDSMVKRVEINGGELAVRVTSDTSGCSPSRNSYSLFVHEGTEAHWIFPIFGTSLAFYWANGPDGAGMYFLPSVFHPGTEAIPFFRDNLGIFAAPTAS